MILACPECGKRYKTDPKRIPHRGGFVRCPACKARIPVQAAPSPEFTDATAREAAPGEPAAPTADASHAASAEPSAQATPYSAPAPVDDTGVVHVLAEEGLLAARDLDEVREWIFEGRIWPDNLVFVPGDEARRADAHPLTRELFLQARELTETAEEKPEATEFERPSPPPEAEAAAAPDPDAFPGSTAAVATPEAAWEAPAPEAFAGASAEEEITGEPWPAPPAESEVDLAALHARARLPGGVRAFAALNLVLSLTLPPNPLGVAAAVGLLRGRAWGRTLTTAWAGLQILLLLILWSGLTALLLARGPLASVDLQAPRVPPGLEPLVLGVLAFAALGAYFLFQCIYLSRSGIAARFGGDGERAALWAGWIVGWAYLSAVALATLVFVPRLAAWAPLARLAPPAPEAPRVAAPAPPVAVESPRVHSADGRVSIEVPPRWTVTTVGSGPDAQLGLLLQGSREHPAGTLRVSTARPQDVDRMNRRFDKLEGDQRTLQSVEDVAIGDLIGRRIVLSSKLREGVTGQVLVSLHDEERGYQFSCAATGPGFDLIRPECDRMAESLLIVRTPAVPAGDAAAAAPTGGGSPGGEATGQGRAAGDPPGAGARGAGP